MYQYSTDRIAHAASFLGSPAAVAARPYLQEPLQLAMDILDLVEGDWRTSEAIADCLEKKGRTANRETVTQVLRSLKIAHGLESSNKGWRRKL